MSATDYPYSDGWRIHTRERMLARGITAESIGSRTGLDQLAVEALLGRGPVSIEVAGPIEDYLDDLDTGRELSSTGRTLLPADRPIRVGPVMGVDGQQLDVGALADYDVEIELDAFEQFCRRDP